MALRLFRFSFAAILIAVTAVTFAQAGVLQLVPISEVGGAQELGVSRDSAAWVSEDGAPDECYADSGAVISSEGDAEVEESSDGGMPVEATTPVPPQAAMDASTVSVNLPGDVDGDGDVDQDDANVIAAHWQQNVTGGSSEGDFNGDGKVDGSDVTILAYYWGTSPIAVPEPSTIALLLCGTIGLIVARRCRRA